MKRVPLITGLGVMLMLAVAAPSWSATKSKKAAQPVDNTPVVTPDTSTPPTGTAAPTNAVQVAPAGSTAPAAYAVPVGGAQVPAPAAVQPAAPQGPPEPAVMVRAEQCLRGNAETIARAEPSPKLAVDLLLADVCAEEVDAASLYTRNLDALARFNPVSERGRAGLSTARVDPETGQILAPSNVDVSSAVDAAERSALKIAPNLRKYAAELVLNEKAHLATAKKPH